jgi:hypothetical protein
MDGNRYTIGDVIRMAGHLLDKHPTTGENARNVDGGATHESGKYATCWCVEGAVWACSRRLGYEGKRVMSQVNALIGVENGLFKLWDEGTDQYRNEVVEKMKGYRG